MRVHIMKEINIYSFFKNNEITITFGYIVFYFITIICWEMAFFFSSYNYHNTNIDYSSFLNGFYLGIYLILCLQFVCLYRRKKIYQKKKGEYSSAFDCNDFYVNCFLPIFFVENLNFSLFGLGLLCCFILKSSAYTQVCCICYFFI